MRFRILSLGILLPAVAAVGCSSANKPYADDPLIRSRRAVIANPIHCPPVEKWERPVPPPPPPER
ncbi:MAG: hypothetical protein MUF18_04925 [Fimbriiglobus sp.]|nr:hypothetical protein [Fimbriiglobus sp.]